ncbi:MAG: lptD [Gammaproteobacteria bacterium]|jgi:LPS-assembly protein|nr:lptD [Gammaproteobacteria bacterium]
MGVTFFAQNKRIGCGLKGLLRCGLPITLIFCTSALGAAETAATAPAKTETKMDTAAPDKNDYSHLNWSQMTPLEVASQLGFVDDTSSNQVCRGYYVEPSFTNIDAALQANQVPINASADESELSLTGVSVLKGNVILEQPNQMVGSDLLYIYRDADSGQVENIQAYGHVFLRRPGELVIGDSGTFNLGDKTGQMEQAVYRRSLINTSANITAIDDNQSKVTGVNAWGKAAQFSQTKDGLIVINQGTYTTCPPLERVWSVKASRITLDHDTGTGTAKNARLYYKEMPIFYIPYMSFPIDARRKSGFLMPNAGYSSQSGYDVAVPYYLNLAPNYDMTFMPEYMSARGVNLNDDFRYLNSNGGGDFHGAFLPGDRAFSQFQSDEAAIYDNGAATDTPATYNRLEDASDNRYFVSWKDDRQYDPHWSSNIYVNRVSDDYYFQDFNSDPAQTSDYQIHNIGDVAYNSDHWYFKTMMEGYQTLHPVNQAPVANSYEKLPEVILNANYPQAVGDVDVGVNNQFDYFTERKTPGATISPPDGSRAITMPQLTLPLYFGAGYLKPNVQLSAAQYSLSNQVPGEDSTISRTLPIYDVDGGLFFDKEGSWFGHAYQQTLEPRLFYLYVPYRNQDDIPLFDTTVEPFTYDQLFRTNRFTGYDRIGDTNQISYSLTSRILDADSGVEKMHVSVGEIYYFENRRVNIDPLTLDVVTLYNSVPPDNTVSPIASEASYRVTQDWSFNGNLAWNPQSGSEESATNSQTGETDIVQIPRGFNNGGLALQYKRDNNHIFNIGYSFLRGGDQLVDSNGQLLAQPGSSENNLNQTDVSAVWPLSPQWKTFSRWNYNVSQGHNQNVMGGLEYDTCCWALRLVGAHAFNYLDAEDQDNPRYNNMIYLQVALIGLGNVSTSNAAGLLRDSIVGYTDTFGAPLSTLREAEA